MRIAVINEVSASKRNPDILRALEAAGREVLNLGMSCPEEKPELTYLHTGFMSAVALELGICDFVVGGCGTGQGYLNSVLQYPGVVCGLILEPLDAWLFTRINDGNCVSLALNKGYGWAGELNLKMLFDHLFAAEKEGGFPANRVASQTESRKRLKTISRATHLPMTGLVQAVDPELIGTVMRFERFSQAVREADDCELKRMLLSAV